MTKRASCLYRYVAKEKCCSSEHTVFKAMASSVSVPCGYVIIFLSFQAVTQLELFGDMSTPPDITSPPVSMHCPLSPASLPFPSFIS